MGEEAWNDEQEGRNQRSKQEGRDNARRQYDHRALRLRLKMVEAERGADEEHVEPDAHLRTDIEDAPRFLGKERRLKFGEEEAVERRDDEDARDHLADDLRLAEEFVRLDERRAGGACVRTYSSRWWLYHSKKKTILHIV